MGARSRSLDTGGSAELSLPSKRVALLLDSIPVELLARAAFQCGAHARALLYFETHVRAKDNGALNPAALRSASYSDEEVSFFQVKLRILWLFMEAKSVHDLYCHCSFDGYKGAMSASRKCMGSWRSLMGCRGW